MKIKIPDQGIRNVTREFTLNPIEEQFWLAVCVAHYSALLAVQSLFPGAMIEAIKIADIATGELVKRR